MNSPWGLGVRPKQKAHHSGTGNSDTMADNAIHPGKAYATGAFQVVYNAGTKEAL